MARIPQMYQVRYDAPVPSSNPFWAGPTAQPRGTNPFSTPNGSDVSLPSATPAPAMRKRNDSDLSSIGGLMLSGGEYEELEHGRRGYDDDHAQAREARGPALAPDLRARLHARIRSLEAELDTDERTSGYSWGSSETGAPIAPARVGAPRGINNNTGAAGGSVDVGYGPGAGAGAPSPAARTTAPRHETYAYSDTPYAMPEHRFQTPPLRVGSPRSSRPQSPATPRTRPADFTPAPTTPQSHPHPHAQGYFPPTPQSPERRPPPHAQGQGQWQPHGHGHGHAHGRSPSKGNIHVHVHSNSQSHSHGHGRGSSNGHGQLPAQHNYHYERTAPPPPNNYGPGSEPNYGRPPPPRPTTQPVGILQPTPRPPPPRGAAPNVALQLPFTPTPVSAHLAAPPRAYVSPFSGTMTPPASPSPPDSANKSIAGHDYLREKHATFREGEDEVFTPFSPRARQAGPRTRGPGVGSNLGPSRKSVALSTVDFWKRFSTVAKLDSSNESAWMVANRKRRIWRNPYFVVPLFITLCAVGAVIVWLVIKLTKVKSI